MHAVTLGAWNFWTFWYANGNNHVNLCCVLLHSVWNNKLAPSSIAWEQLLFMFSVVYSQSTTVRAIYFTLLDTLLLFGSRGAYIRAKALAVCP